ncbi:MAG: DUF4198 domain-containing protein [Cyclobacteriaceae bacterium]|jgi:uncharacterized GH25 family protein|nr:DUF4198 domain-containing protein [Cyclobacteriaceae bacterium]
MKRLFCMAVVAVVCATAQAHEFWLQPQKYLFAVGETAVIDFKVGENFTGEDWDMKRHKVEQLSLHKGTASLDLLPTVHATAGKNVAYPFAQAGTHQFFLKSNAAFIELEGEKFNAYLKEDGIDEIVELRTQRNESATPAREFYTRYAKLLVQVGDGTTPHVTRPLGALHEIVPQQNPYALKTGDYLTVKVFYAGKARPHALVKVWTKRNRTTFLQNLYTENDGTLTFPINSPGEWMVSSVKMVPSAKTGADYESAWASLVFAINESSK